MKREVERLVDQLDRAHRGDAWHGPDLSALLKDVDAGDAEARPVAGGHSIAELVRHVIAWQDEAVRRLKGEGKEDLPPEEDWPGESEPWEKLAERLESSYRNLREAIRDLDDQRLDEGLPGHPGTVYRLLHGVVQHNLYHAGQIAILKKALVGVSR